MRKQRRIRRTNKRFRRPLFGVDLEITYRGIDMVKDGQIRKVLGAYSTGSGAGFFEKNKPPLRDHTATVPREKFDLIMKRLRRIPGIKVKRLVTRWVLCR